MRACLAVMLIGCGYNPTPSAGGDAPLPPADMAIDVNGDITLLCTTWTSNLFDPCDLDTPMPGLQLDAGASPYTFDSDTGEMRNAANQLFYSTTETLTQNGGPTASLINIASFGISQGATLFLVGSRPVVLASWDAATIDGTIDASSSTGFVDMALGRTGSLRTGAGGNQNCGTGTGNDGGDAATTGGSGGGAGGALAGFGGDGGLGDFGTGNGNRPGGIHGISVARPAFLRGGCAGGASGKAGDNATPAGAGLQNAKTPGGDGGGAIWIATRTAITINASGVVHAGGGGGGGPEDNTANGGGGGGSGGMVALESIAISVDGTLAANGGGGGSGACFANPAAQGDNALGSAMQANGGVSGAQVQGGDGAAAAVLVGGTPVTSDSCGGGGGGGGAGFISIYKHGGSFAHTGTISPDAAEDPN